MSEDPKVILGETRYKTERETLAMILDQIMNEDLDSPDRNLRADVWLAASLAERLGYPVGFDHKGRLHISLPTEPHRVQFVMGFENRFWPLPGDSEFETATRGVGDLNRQAIKAFSDAVLPPIAKPREDAS